MKNLHLQPANELLTHVTPVHLQVLFFGKMCAKVDVRNSALRRQKVTVSFPGV